MTTLFNRIIDFLIGAKTPATTQPHHRLDDFSRDDIISYALGKGWLTGLHNQLYKAFPEGGIKNVIDLATDFASVGTVSNDVVASLIHNACGSSLTMRLSDWNYQLVHEARAIEFFNQMGVDKLNWQKDDGTVLSPGSIGDCDEFMFAAAGLANIKCGRVAFGIASNGSHAFNVCVNERGQLCMFEPQTNQFTPVTRGTGIISIWM